MADIFDEVQSGRTLLGVVPFENSSNGPVVFTLDDFADRDKKYSDIAVNGDIYVDVHHYLLGHIASAAAPAAELDGTSTPTASDPNPTKPKATPLTNLDKIKRVYSHPQAFGQCKAFLSTYLKGAETLEVSSTSKAAELVSNDTSGESAAISSELAGKLYHLDTLAKSIEDRDDNKTRFLVISKDFIIPKQAAQLNWPRAERTGTKSLISFTVPHNAPGALADALGGFKENGVNLTSINTRPTGKEAFQYIFFVEFEGSRLDDEDGSVNAALEEINKVAESWRWLGSWDTYQ